MANGIGGAHRGAQCAEPGWKRRGCCHQAPAHSSARAWAHAPERGDAWPATGRRRCRRRALFPRASRRIRRAVRWAGRRKGCWQCWARLRRPCAVDAFHLEGCAAQGARDCRQGVRGYGRRVCARATRRLPRSVRRAAHARSSWRAPSRGISRQASWRAASLRPIRGRAHCLDRGARRRVRRLRPQRAVEARTFAPWRGQAHCKVRAIGQARRKITRSIGSDALRPLRQGIERRCESSRRGCIRGGSRRRSGRLMFL
mmetsp:Transcript_4331/g.10760  ORF Transcript_4331/g.10760 Transcript_4331/m.10760 type:complete len:257 (+) Transcript_4331:641-1411(+)